MKEPASLRYAYSIFCDDIRNEEGNKRSYIGVYGSNIVFSGEAPQQLPKFCIVANLVSSIADAPQQISISVYVPPGRTLLHKSPPIAPPPPPPSSEPSDKVSAQFLMPITGLVLAEPGYIEVELETEREITQAGRLAVVFSTPETPAVASAASAPEAMTAEASTRTARQEQEPPRRRRRDPKIRELNSEPE